MNTQPTNNVILECPQCRQDFIRNPNLHRVELTEDNLFKDEYYICPECDKKERLADEIIFDNLCALVEEKLSKLPTKVFGNVTEYKSGEATIVKTTKVVNYNETADFYSIRTENPITIEELNELL